MKVLLANKYFFHKGGAETVFFQEREFLLSSGVQVVDFSMKDRRNLPSSYADFFVSNRDYRDEKQGLASKAHAALSMLYSTEAVRKFERLIKKERPDILHCHNIYHQLTPAILRAAKKLGVKTVLTLHDYKVVCPVYTRLCNGHPCDKCLNGDFLNVVRHRCAEGSLARSALLYTEAEIHKRLGSYKNVDRAIAVSRFMRDSVTAWRFPPERVSLLYNGVQVRDTPSSDEGYLLYLGRLSAEKGVPTLAQAQNGTNIRVVVAGTGPLEYSLRQDYPSLEFVGHQTGAPLQALIDKAAAIVVPSAWHENCPMSVLEAMAAGKAVIGSRMGGIPELVIHEETGLLFKAGNVEDLRQCMQDIVSNPERRKRMGLNARERIKKDFSLQQHNEKLLALYETVRRGK